MNRRTLALALLLIAAGVCFRVWAVEHARFTGDESYFWATARNVAKLEATPVFGPPLTGSSAHHPGPIFYYLMAVPQGLGASPWIGGVFVVLLHALSAWFFFLLLRRALGDRAGLIGLVLLAFAPWDVLYADRIWLSCVAPVWGTATIYAASRAGSSARWLGAFVFLALVCPQLHMSAPVVWVVAAVLLVFEPPPRWSKAAIAAGTVLAVIAYAPAIHFELTHGFENTVAIATKGTGKLDLTGRLLAPLRVFGYAILYSTSEIGYHFARGYWSPFDEAGYYFTGAGARSWLRLHGISFAAGILVSVLAAFAAWGLALLELGRRMAEARRAGGIRSNLPFGPRLLLGMLLGLGVAAALMVVAKKEYFPHYTNLLMPLALWPLVQALDLALSRERLRAAALAILAISTASMMSSSARYYRDVDALNGLGPTLSMVERVMEDVVAGRPVGATFDGFHNAFAWQMIASTAYGRPLELRGDAKIRYRVHNAEPHRGPAPPGTELFGPVLLERRNLGAAP